MMRLYWSVAHPTTHGALLAIWHEGEILLVRNSYVPYYSLPGGYVHRDETGRQAAARELFEETGVRVRSEDFRQVIDQQHEWEGKREHIEIFELELAERPLVKVDNREVIRAEFFRPEKALMLESIRPLRHAIERRMGHGQAPSPIQA